MSLWGELKRRDVFKVAVAYLLASWLIVQVVSLLSDALTLPDELDTVVVVLLAIGFPFALIIAWVYEVTPEGVRVTSGNGRIRTSAPSQRLTFVLSSLFVIAVGLMALERFSGDPSASSFGTGSRVAILPCTNLSPDPSNTFFAPGIHTELIAHLGSLSGLDVVPQTSVLRFADAPTSIPDVAEELQADAVMSCVVQYSGDLVRLTTSLIDGVSETQLWSATYTADMSDLNEIFQIQADIAMNVGNALRVEFLDEERERIERPPTGFSEAYVLYLAAEAARQPGTADGIQRAIELLEKAVDIDPMYVQAWTLLANLKTIIASNPSAELDGAIAAAETAIELAPENGDGYAQLGFAQGVQHEWLAAEASYRRALELGWPLANMPQYSTHLLAVGHIEQAIETLESNLEVNALNSDALGFLMIAYSMSGDVAKVDELYERGRELHGDWFFGNAMSISIRLGRGDIESLRELIGPSAQGMHAELLDVADDPDSAREILLRYASGSGSRRGDIANWAAYLGDVDLAIDALRETARDNGLFMRLAWQPLYREVRPLPEFQSLLKELGLIDYWNETEWPEFCQQLSDGEIECL